MPAKSDSRQICVQSPKIETKKGHIFSKAKLLLVKQEVDKSALIGVAATFILIIKKV